MCFPCALQHDTGQGMWFLCRVTLLACHSEGCRDHWWRRIEKGFLKNRTCMQTHRSLLLCKHLEAEADAHRFSLLGRCLPTGALCLLEEMPLCLAGRASFLGDMLLARLGRCRAAMRSLLRAMCSARSRSYADISSTFCISKKPITLRDRSCHTGCSLQIWFYHNVAASLVFGALHQ